MIEYLNQQESVHQFLANVMSLVDASVSDYQRRGFTSLDGVVRLHRRPASLGLFRGAIGEAFGGRNGVEVVVRHLELESMTK